MTDNEIIKALECCTKGTTSDVCVDCPLRTTDICIEEENGVLKLALDLINRQKEEIQRLEKEKHDLETQLAINKGAMRAYREAFEKAHDEAVADFSHFLIDKAKDGSIDICDLPDLVAEWRSPERKDAELMKDVNAAFDEAAEGMKPSPALRATSPEGRGKKFFLTCRNPEAEHWILKRFSDLSRR